MAGDLSGIISSVTPISYSSDFPGLQLPTLSNGNFGRGLPTGCIGCGKAVSTHKAWDNLTLGPASKTAQWSAEFVTAAEAIRDRIDLLRSLVQLCNRQAHGITAASSVGGIPPSNEYTYELVSCSSNSVTVKYQAGDQDPRTAAFTSYTDNGNWGGGNPKYDETSSNRALPPRGVLTLDAPSAIQNHGGLIVYRIRPAAADWDTFAVDDNFIFYTHGTWNSALALTKQPLGGSTIKVRYSCYITNEEQWATYRHSYPLYVKGKTKTISNVDTNTEYTLEAAARIRAPAAGWITATHKTGGGDVDETATLIAITEVQHNGAAYKTIFDTTGYGQFDGTSDLDVTYYIETTDNSGLPAGQDRCSRARIDLTKSYGTADGSGRRWYCHARKTADLAATFLPACYQTGCSLWDHEDAPTNPLNQPALEQLTHSFPWLYEQSVVAQAVYKLTRFGCPSLASLAGMNTALSTGWHLLKQLNAVEAEGWARAIQLPPHNLWFKNFGFEWLTFSDDGDLPDLIDSNTWPSYGPAGANWSKDAELPPTVGITIATDTDDPHKTNRAQILKRSKLLNPYTGAVSGTYGKYQDSSPVTQYEMFFSSIDPTNRSTTQTFADGSIEPGYWKADLTSQGAEDGDTVYYWRLLITRGRRYDRGADNDHGGSVVSGTVAYAETTTNGFRFYFELGLERASTQVSAQEERETEWNQGGNIVELPEWAKVYNHRSINGKRGVDGLSRVRNGHVARFTTANGFGLPVAVAGDDRTERRFWVETAQACYSASQTGAFDPDSDQETLSNTQWGRFFYQYDTDETLSTIDIKRDTAVLGDKGTTLTYYGHGDVKPYGMGKDSYWYESYRDTVSGLYGLLIYFDPANGTADPLDYAHIYVNVTTTIKTYAEVDWNLLTDATQGWDNKIEVTLTATRNISSIDTVEVFRRDGTTDTCVLIADPATWSAWALEKYYATNTGADVTIKVSPDYSMDMLRVTCTIADYAGGDYYDDNVLFHGLYNGTTSGGSLPPTHKTWAKRYDMVEVRDEGGLLNTWCAGVPSSFVGQVIDFRDDGVAHHLEFTVNENSFNSEDADSTFSASNYLLLSANGEMFITDSLTGTAPCLILTARQFDRNALPRAEEVDGLRTVIERFINE